jgi:hypothetical protein
MPDLLFHHFLSPKRVLSGKVDKDDIFVVRQKGAYLKKKLTQNILTVGRMIFKHLFLRLTSILKYLLTLIGRDYIYECTGTRTYILTDTILQALSMYVLTSYFLIFMSCILTSHMPLPAQKLLAVLSRIEFYTHLPKND